MLFCNLHSVHVEMSNAGMTKPHLLCRKVVDIVGAPFVRSAALYACCNLGVKNKRYDAIWYIGFCGGVIGKRLLEFIEIKIQVIYRSVLNLLGRKKSGLEFSAVNSQQFSVQYRRWWMKLILLFLNDTKKYVSIHVHYMVLFCNTFSHFLQHAIKKRRWIVHSQK